MDIHLEDMKTGFTHFWEAIGAEGDLEAALVALAQRHNPSSQRSGLVGSLKKLITFNR